METVVGMIPATSALIGFGRVVDRSCAVDVLPGVAATECAVGAGYLTDGDRHLQNPEEL